MKFLRLSATKPVGSLNRTAPHIVRDASLLKAWTWLVVLQWQAHVHHTIQAPVLPTTQVQALRPSLVHAHPPMVQILILMGIRSFHGSKTSHPDLHQHPPPSSHSFISIPAPSVLLSLLQLALLLPDHRGRKLTGRISPLVLGGVGNSTPFRPLPLLQALAARFLIQIGLLG